MTTANTPPWFEDDALWQTARLAMFPPAAFEAAPTEIALALRLAAVEDVIDVLDLPCGPGRHLLPLLAAGHRVVGVDRTAAYLSEAAERIKLAEDRGALRGSVELVEADMRRFRREHSFDLVLNLYTSFGFFQDQDDDRRVLRGFLANLRPGGTLVMDLMSRDNLAARFVPSASRRLEDGTLMLQERKISRDWRWIEIRWTFARDGVERRFDFGHRLYGGVDLWQELRDAGFSDVHLFGYLDGRPYDSHAHRLVVRARRPAS